MLKNGKKLADVCTPVLIMIDSNMYLNTMLECMEFCFKTNQCKIAEKHTPILSLVQLQIKLNFP